MWRHAAAALLALAATTCCPISVDVDERDDGREAPPSDGSPRVDLGDAAAPPNNNARAAEHPWWVPKLAPKSYRLGYKLSAGRADDVHDAYRRYARKVGHKRLSKDRFQWRPPRECLGGLHCVYEQLDEQGRESIEPIAELFRKRARKAKLSALEAAALVITFAQEIRYKIPEDEPFGVLPPPLVVRQRWGDCDSKTLLGHMILRRLGIHSVLVSSNAHKHTMLGLALPSAGTTFTWKGRRYAFVEMTAKRAPIGYIHPKLLRPNDWQVVKLDYTPSKYDAGQPEEDDGAKTPRDDAKQPKEPKQPKERKRRRRRKKRSASDIIGGGAIRVE